MVGVLDVLGEPLLGPVELLTAHWHLHLLKEDPELVVLQLVLGAGKVGDLAELALLIVKVVPVQLLQLSQLVGVIRSMGELQGLLEEDSVLSINLRVVGGKGLIPDIGLGDSVGKFASVTKVSVLDVLDKPVLGPFDLALVSRSLDVSQPVAELGVLHLVGLAVVPVNVLGVAELLLLVDEVVPHVGLELLDLGPAHGVHLNCPHVVEKDLVLIVQSIILKNRI